MLHVQNLQRLALGPLDLTIEKGEIVALTGPSGSGKSMLLRAIADLDPSDGHVTLNAQSREAMPAPQWRRQVMYVPAHSGWWADTVEPHFETASRGHAVEILQRLGIESTALGWQVANLSTGERQRLSLARAMALDPQILLLDEPTSGLDADNQERMEKVIRNFAAREDRAVVFVTHDAQQAARLAGRTLRLTQGQLVKVAP